ncbi:type II restriction endonuclease [Marinobacter sp. TBZ242]|uniref:Type II restriction endonuclease n=1 Tax=Marinobacter azerbaijanicus TaxID=3050455 RepID=A0ABT7IFM0_9GAMM|nr:type II restriction endonuclease [Marinobacter sp. TBZ242]MDL0432967.1 type II restriction endonuclease [Marinobacter sp. TBZ242]
MLDSVNEIFEGAAAKYLSAVDADPARSNQHEIGGLPSVGFKSLLGIPGKSDGYPFPAMMAYLTDEEDAELCQDTVTWYDARWKNPKRSPEYRLYYKSNPVTELIQPTDFFLVAKKHDGSLLLLFTPAGSSVEFQLRHLFGLSDVDQDFTSASMPSQTLILPIKMLLEELGVRAFDEREVQNDLDMLLERFPDKFPKTAEFSALARELTDFDCITDPDAALIGWMEREEALFRAYERHIVSERLRSGFGAAGDDVDEFIAFSLSVQNRRKSRVGHAFENHLGFIFQQNRLPFEKGGGARVTENKAKPDFLFPEFGAYHDPQYPRERIFLLGAKTTCKDRWRQVLSEGDLLERKYLATLEAGISSSQTDEMVAKNLQLVIPTAIHGSFTKAQRNWLFSMADFIHTVKRAL